MKIYVNEENFLNIIPKSPGVYKFYAKQKNEDLLLYVGKAINLFNRVKSYFKNQNSLSSRISLMVSKIDFIEITITDNELSALVIERNLIHSLKPKYNIVFRDDKTYPLIKVTNHKYPRVEVYRGKVNEKDKFFGPFPNSEIVRSNVDLIIKIFKLRTCSDIEFANRDRPCVLYQINRCSAPCVNYISNEDYQEQVDLAIDFLNGTYDKIARNLVTVMNNFSEKNEFEKSAVIRDKLFMIKKLRDSQIVNNYNQPINIDLVFIDSNRKNIFIYLIRVRKGIYVGDKHFVVDNNGELIEEVFDEFIRENYGFFSQADLLYCNKELEQDFIDTIYKFYKIKIITKPDSTIKHLMNTGNVNIDKIKEQYNKNNELKHGCDELCKLLNISSINRIECIDISHNHGDNTVGSLVVYENEIIDSSKYRKYNIDKDELNNQVNGNDLLAMRLLLSRRFKNRNIALPQLIVVDGGINQLNNLKKILIDFELCDKIISMAIFKGNKRNPENDKLILDNGKIIEYSTMNYAFKLIQKLRDEAHRFAIGHHRARQIKKMTTSYLDDIKSIGKKKKNALLAQFGSSKNISKASVEELMKIPGIGQETAEIIFNHFHSME